MAGAVFDHRHVELPRQKQDGERTQPDRGEEPAADVAVEGGERDRALLYGREQGRRVEQHEGHPDTDRREGRELDDRFHGDRQHQPILMLGGVGMAGAEQDGEDGQHQSDQESEVAEQRRQLQRRAVMGDEAIHAGGNRFQLQRDVGHGADDRDHGGEGRDRRVLAVARTDEVGDGGQPLGLGMAHQAFQKTRRQHEDQDRPEIDRQERKAVARRDAHRAEEGPGRAIDGEAQRVDGRPAWPGQSMRGAAVAPPRHGEEQRTR